MQTGTSARYGMVIDLDRCTGCGACAVACAVENNVPPADPGATPRTGITWLRLQRIEDESGRAAFVPLLCQHCGERTPCVAVCPQHAVEVDPRTGIVAQVPPRCLGCRYCMTACPYHARYFNWWDPDWPGEMARLRNPEVATRTRGVVEKCTFCSHRLQAARARAAAGEEASAAPDYLPACVEACPAAAIVFGNLADDTSEVCRLSRTPESLRLLERLGTQPKVYYRTARDWVRQRIEASPARREGASRG